MEFPVVDLSTDLGIDAMAALVHETAKEKGFWPAKYYDYDGERRAFSAEVPSKVTEEAIGTKLALVHSEVTEVLEAVRKDQGKEAIVEEMADILIRTFDLYAALYNTGQVDSSLESVVQSKMKKNALRPKLHGNKF